MFEGSGFQATYNVTAKPAGGLTSGRWYFGFDCTACRARFAVFDDPSAGAKAFTSERPCVFRVACPECKVERLYRTDQVRQFQAK
jgi:hypothetical protein